MPFHVCADELLMILYMIPFLTYPVYRLRIWWYSRFHKNCVHEIKHEDHKDPS